MKKIFTIALVLILCLAMMAGCAQKDDPTSAEDDDTSAGMANPVQTYDDIQGQIDAVGFGLEAPEGAENVVYQSIQSMAETVFTLDGVSYSYRAESTDKTEAYDISGLYYDMEESTASVQGREATVMICEEAGAVIWLDIVPGINYSLSTASAVDADALVELADSIFAPVQGES